MKKVRPFIDPNNIMLLCEKCYCPLGYYLDFKFTKDPYLKISRNIKLGVPTEYLSYSTSMCPNCKSNYTIKKIEKITRTLSADIGSQEPITSSNIFSHKSFVKYELNNLIKFDYRFMDGKSGNVLEKIRLNIRKYNEKKEEDDRLEFMHEEQKERNRIEKIKKDRRAKRDEEWKNSNWLQKYWVFCLVALAIILFIIF